jgi:hypothetical protein
MRRPVGDSLRSRPGENVLRARRDPSSLGLSIIVCMGRCIGRAFLARRFERVDSSDAIHLSTKFGKRIGANTAWITHVSVYLSHGPAWKWAVGKR